jgi:molybdate transport system ATP-binding protein
VSLTAGEEQPRAAALDAVVQVRQGGFLLDVALQASAGSVVAVVGPNGAGKSTLLRVLAGLLPLTSGRVVLTGRVLADAAQALHLPPYERSVGLLFQDYRLFPHLSVRDNVAFGLRARGTRRRQARAAADAWLGRLGLDGLGDRRPAALSGGQAQRVALARALAVEPALLLLDEPLAALDAGTRAAVRADLRRHLAAFGGPSLLVTHDPLEAMTLADRLVVLERGRVVQSGTPREVARRPRTRYVGQLVGLNVYRGTVADGVLRVDGGGTLRCADALSGPAVAAVRPSAVTLHAAAPARSSSRNTWSGVLETLEPFGDRVRATVRAELPLLADITVAAVAELSLQPGTPVWASVKATEVDVYPEE